MTESMDSDRIAREHDGRRVAEAALDGLYPGPAHFVGIGGIGMSGLARLLLDRGWRVTGCDAAENRQTAWLRARGVRVEIGHDPAHLAAPPAPRWLIYSPAVPADHPELRRARELSLVISRRGHVLPALVNRYPRSMAVAGAHGKTTTATMLAQILVAAGCAPSFCIGGESDALGGPADGAGREWMVVEADESDGTLAAYAPTIAIVHNIDHDHLEHFATFDELRDVFRAFVAQTRGHVLYHADDPAAAEVAAARPNACAYGFGPDARFRARRRSDGDGHRLEIALDGRPLLAARLPVPGRHNAANALAAAAAAHLAGVAPETTAAALEKFQPARRRLEPVRRGAIRIWSDYAHHPAEIRALVSTLREAEPGRLFAVFQPHRYSRTRALADRFPAAFAGLDHLWLTPVYAASETPLPGGDSAALYDRIRRAGAPPVTLCDSLIQAWEEIRGILRPGDRLLIVGAGDIEKIAAWAAAGDHP